MDESVDSNEKLKLNHNVGYVKNSLALKNIHCICIACVCVCVSGVYILDTLYTIMVDYQKKKRTDIHIYLYLLKIALLVRVLTVRDFPSSFNLMICPSTVI